MRFAPKTAAEIAAEASRFGAWPRGTYDFEVTAAQDATSKAGNEMIVLDLLVFNAGGQSRKMKDWLVETVPVKLKHACEAVGLHSAYEVGNVDSQDFVGRAGKLTLAIERREGFDERNKVSGYVPLSEVQTTPRRPAAPRQETARQAVPAGGGNLDDEIPF